MGRANCEYASFYSYDEKEEVNEERFNRFVNLGITAEDMEGMLDNTININLTKEILFHIHTQVKKN